MEESGRPRVYPLVYLLLVLALTLPVATATIVRAFSATYELCEESMEKPNGLSMYE